MNMRIMRVIVWSVLIVLLSCSQVVDESFSSARENYCIQNASECGQSASSRSSGSFNASSSSDNVFDVDSLWDECFAASKCSLVVDSRESVIRRYRSVKIENQWWLTDPLNYGEFSNSSVQNKDSQAEKYCENGDTTTCAMGGYYLWAESMDIYSRCNTIQCLFSEHTQYTGICPTGFHIPSRDEFGKLALTLRKDSVIRLFFTSDQTPNTTSRFWSSSQWNDSLEAYYFELRADTSSGLAYGYKNSKFKVLCASDSAVVESEHFYDRRDGTYYETVALGSQTWFAHDLVYAGVQNSTCLTLYDKSCAYNGLLYTQAAALSACPSGWHLPSRSEWDTLQSWVRKELNLDSNAGTAPYLLDTTNAAGYNSVGFSALIKYFSRGNVPYYGESRYWTSTSDVSDYTSAYSVSFSKGSAAVGYYTSDKSSFNLLVRCMEN